MISIETKNLTKKFKEKTVVNGIELRINEGELFALLGTNGAGKTTTIKMLSTLILPTDGEIKINGLDIIKDRQKIKEIINVSPQETAIAPNLSVKENLEFMAGVYQIPNKEEKINELVKMFKLEEVLNQKAKTLSGGWQRKVSIAIALINEPKILFLDEPTTGLDPKSRSIVWEYINKLRSEKKLTIFLTTHYMEEVVNADRVVILDKGEIVENDTPANLKTKYTSTKLYWYTNESKENEDLIDNYDYKYEVDHYIINMESDDIRNFIYKNKIESFEVFKGTMDDVFLKLTGKELK